MSGFKPGSFVTPFLALILNEYHFFCLFAASLVVVFSSFFFYYLSYEISRVVNRWALIELCGP